MIAVAAKSPERPRVGRASFGLWLIAAAAAAGIGFGLATSPLLLFVALVAVAAGASFVLAFNQPRWTFVIVLFLAEGYVPDVASLYHGNGLPLTGALLAGISLPLAIRYAAKKEKRNDLPMTDLTLLLALAIAMGFSSLLATDPSAGLHRIVTFSKDVPFCILMLLLLDRTVWLRRAAWAAVFALGGLGGLAVFQQLTHTFARTYFGFATVQGDHDLIRSAGPLSTDWFGWELVPATMLALYLGISARSRRERLLGLTLFAASLLGIVYSFARASLIAVFAALLLAGILRRLHPAAYIVAIGVAVLALVVFLPSTAKSRLVGVTAPVTGSVASASDVSVRNRAGENLAALHMFLDHPYLGVGPGNYPVLYTKYSETVGLDPRNEARPPHNLYLEALAETGVVGTLLLLALIGRALRGAWRARGALPGRDGLLCEGVFVALVGYMINGFFLHPSAYSRYLWLTIGFGLVCERLARSARVGAA